MKENELTGKQLLVGAVVAIVAILLMFCSCKAHEKLVVVTEHRTDTTYIVKQRTDSIWMHDSIHVREKGDTVMIERWHTMYKEKMIRDTLLQCRVDSVPVPYPVERLVEKPLTWWQKARLSLANILLALLGGSVLYCMVRRKLHLP
jgi:hypothetical protein